ncbi:MAG: transcription elongation factor GreA [Candidatus Dojkabacteria bacterium]|uniref:Transcription elongation factor GreA n=1 Tax=Candidatus Dojkabacteria bacterium TaxID=2099670 RepID=A0A952AK20_9BACT|nr:transcription elongation factor GreA [Candidatus Dojkabacteria bacterium]WKZ27888.1 MAG: transcription elongation factor GreA [Candidatus Dojkabacteria bacterium]
MQPKLLLTQEGFDELEKELNERISVTRNKIADDIDHARQQGDLSENAAYKAAMEAKEFNENRIAKIEDMLKNAEISVASKGKKVDIGKTVTLVIKGDSKPIEFQIVGHSEADPAQRKISPESPIGSALMGKKEGDKVLVELPAGSVEYLIKKVN